MGNFDAVYGSAKERQRQRCRHTYVTHCYLRHKNDPDFDLATFSKSIGHPGIRTTMEIYAHLDMTVNRYISGELADLKDF